MKTLVIHPYDPTTEMLGDSYEGKGWTVIRDNSTPKRHLKEAIKEHDRIVMLGHGSPFGLFAKGRIIIDSTYAYLLREKKLIAVWCDADKFFEKYNLKGFYTGMIISETHEARFCKVEATQDDVDESNELFGNALTESIDKKDMLGSFKKEYVGNTPTINFNKVRLFKR